MTETFNDETQMDIWLEDFINELLELAGLDLWIEELAIDDNDYLHVELGGEDAGIAIGREGQGLDALQHLVVSAAIRKGLNHKRILLDIEGYRRRRETRLTEEAGRAADNVLSSGRPSDMSPMNARERRIVHMAISQIDGVATESVGEGMDRFVKIVPAG